MKEKNGLKNKIVVQSNKLVNAQHKMTKNQAFLFRMAVAALDTAKSSRKVQIRKQDIFDFLGVSDTNMYTRFKEEVYSLQDSAKVVWEDGDDIIRSVVFTNIIWHRKHEHVTFVFNEYLIPQLLQLKEYFTKYQLESISNLRSLYSLRIYELAKSKIYSEDSRRSKAQRHWEFSVDEIKQKLDCVDKYADIRDFEKWVLKPACEDINYNADLFIRYEKVKRGKSIIGIKFFFKNFSIESKTYYIKNYSKKEYLQFVNEVLQ